MKVLQAALALVGQQVRQGLFAAGSLNHCGANLISVQSARAAHATTIGLGESLWNSNGRGPGSTSLAGRLVVPSRQIQHLVGRPCRFDRLFDVSFSGTSQLAIAQNSLIPRVTQPSRSYTLYEMHKRGKPVSTRKKRRPLDGKPFMKGVVLKTLIKNPKKPNSGNRKCVLVRLSNGKEKFAHVPGVGHTLQEHNIVLVKCRRLKDTPGVWLKVVRGKYDCGHVDRKPQRVK